MNNCSKWFVNHGNMCLSVGIFPDQKLLKIHLYSISSLRKMWHVDATVTCFIVLLFVLYLPVKKMSAGLEKSFYFLKKTLENILKHIFLHL